MKTAECEGIETGGRAAGARPARRAWNRWSRSPAATTSRPWWMPAATAARRWSAARPIAAPGMITAYVPHRQENRSAAWRATACWPAAPNWASTRTTPAFVELDCEPGAPLAGCAARQHHRDRQQVASRTGPICGAITAWRAKWPPFWAQAARSGAAGSAAGRAGRHRDRRSKISTCARGIARWCSRTSPCSPRRSGCNAG